MPLQSTITTTTTTIAQFLSHCNNGKALSLGSATAKCRWEDVRPAAKAMMEQCLQYAEESKVVLADTSRWKTPAPTKHLPNDAEIKRAKMILNPVLKPTATAAYAKRWSLCVHKYCQKPSAQFAFVVLEPSAERLRS